METSQSPQTPSLYRWVDRHRLTTHTSWSKRARTDHIWAGRNHASRFGVEMVGGQIACPGKGERFRGLTWAKGKTPAALIRTPIINAVDELYDPAKAVGCDMEGGSVGDRHVGPALEPCYALGAHRHIDARHLEGRGLHTGARHFDLWRIDGIGAAHEHFRDSWIGMIGRKRSRASKGIGLHGLTRANSDTCIGLPPTIVEGVRELDRSASSIDRNMEGSGVSEAR